MASDHVTLLRKRIGRSLIIVLVETPAPDSRTVRIQNYIRNGKSFIPVFESAETFRAATAGTRLDRPVWEIDRRLLVAVLKGDETFVLNPGLDSELVFSADELRRAFPEPFDPKERGWLKP